MMKKVLFATLGMVFMMLAFAGCSNDDEGSNTLNGTSWARSDEEVNVVITFAEKTFKATVFTKETGNTAIEEGTYVYNPPTVSFTYIDTEEGEKITSTAKIEGNKLIFVDPEDGDTIMYVKK